ncbi:MAG: sugar phosphate isomerase/epimerase [Verrucomicrobiota bacterium]
MISNTTPRLWTPGFSSLGCVDLDLLQMFSLAKEFSIRHIELRAIENQMDLPTYFSKRFTTLEHAKEFILAAGVKIVSLGTSFRWIQAPEGGREDFLRFCSLANSLDIPYVRVFGGSAWGIPLTDEDYQLAVHEYQWWEIEREKNDWKVQAITETHDAFSASQPLIHLMGRLGKGIPILWDTHHTWKYGEESLSTTWKALKEFIVHIHFKDSISPPSPHFPFTYVVPGAGEFPIQDLQSILNQNTYQGTVSLEWERKWHPYLPELRIALEAAQKKAWF